MRSPAFSGRQGIANPLSHQSTFRMQRSLGSTLTLENDRIRATMLPSFGGRIVSLTDRRTGRQWLVEGEPHGSSGGDAIYGAREACGWDECFPTVAPCRHIGWPGVLRDHGELWGRAWQARPEEGSIAAWYESDRFRFSRSIGLKRNELVACYSVTNLDRVPFAYVWSQHCLLAVNTSDRIRLDGIVNPVVRDGVLKGRMLHRQPFDWPKVPGIGSDLTRIMDSDAELALKIHAGTEDRPCATVHDGRSAISFSWSGLEVPAVGLWLNYGGWQEGCPVHHIAIEPTTANSDSLASAEAIGMARVLESGQTHSWRIVIALFQQV